MFSFCLFIYILKPHFSSIWCNNSLQRQTSMQLHSDWDNHKDKEREKSSSKGRGFLKSLLTRRRWRNDESLYNYLDEYWSLENCHRRKFHIWRLISLFKSCVLFACVMSISMRLYSEMPSMLPMESRKHIHEQLNTVFRWASSVPSHPFFAIALMTGWRFQCKQQYAWMIARVPKLRDPQ
jgi:hypothetical protein